MNLQEALHDEVAEALHLSSGKGWADPGLLPRLVLLESAIRESFRCNPISLIVAERKVLPKGGIALPSGETIPQGTILGIPTIGIHRDENIYQNAERYDPFRFCNRRPDHASANVDDAPSGPRTSSTVVNVTDSFLNFGVGKYAW